MSSEKATCVSLWGDGSHRQQSPFPAIHRLFLKSSLGTHLLGVEMEGLV